MRILVAVAVGWVRSFWRETWQREGGKGSSAAARVGIVGAMPAIIKPDFVVHGTENCAIYSLHVSPDGRRLATAGQGERIPSKPLCCVSGSNETWKAVYLPSCIFLCSRILLVHVSQLQKHEMI